MDIIALILCVHCAFGVQTLYTSSDATTFGDFALGAGFDINRFEPKSAHVFKEANNDLLYDIMPVTSTKTRCAMVSRTKDVTDRLHVHGALSVTYNMISGSGHVTFDRKKETMSRVAYYACTVDRSLFTISVNSPAITQDWDASAFISNDLLQLGSTDLRREVGDYHIKSITYGRRYNTEIQMTYTSDDAFDMIEGKLKAKIGMGAISASAEVQVRKTGSSYEEDLTLKISSEALGFIESQPLFMPSRPTTKKGEGVNETIELSVPKQIEDMVQKNLNAFNKLDAKLDVTPKTGLSKQELFAEMGDAYPLYYTIEGNYRYFRDALDVLSTFEEENMLRNLDQAYDILRELQDMQENVENRAAMLFESYNLLSGATQLSLQFLNIRLQLLKEVSEYRSEVTEYLKLLPIQLAEKDVYTWAKEEGKDIMHISIDLLHTKVWDLLGMEDVRMDDENPIGATCLFNGIQATLNGERKKFAGRVYFGDLTVRHVLFDVNGTVVSLGYIDHGNERGNSTKQENSHELVFVRQDCTLLRKGSAVWYEGSRYTIDSIGSDEHLTARGFVNKEKMTNIRLQLSPKDYSRDVQVVITSDEVQNVHLRGYENSYGFTLDDSKRLMYQDGYVCDSGFSAHEARMICTQLGYTGLQNFEVNYEIPAANAWARPRITMNSLKCMEFATELSDCSFETSMHGAWNKCTTNHGIQLQCSDDENVSIDQFRIYSDKGNACIRDGDSAMGELVDTAESCVGGEFDTADDIGHLTTVTVDGDICVKFYRDGQLRCVMPEGEYDFTKDSEKTILNRFCYHGQDAEFSGSLLEFPEQVQMMESDSFTLNITIDVSSFTQGQLNYEDFSVTVKLVDYESGSRRSTLSRFWRLTSLDGVTGSFVSPGTKKYVLGNEFKCGSSLELTAFASSQLPFVDCKFIQDDASSEGRMSEDGQILMTGNFTARLQCFDPTDALVTPSPSNATSEGIKDFSFDTPGWMEVPDGTLVTGFFRQESLGRAYYTSTQFSSTCSTQNWWSNDQWMECPENYGIKGLYLVDNEDGTHLREGRCCHGVSDECQIIPVPNPLHHEVECPTNFALRGMRKADCGGSNCIESLRCCKVSESPTVNPTARPSGTPTPTPTTGMPSGAPSTSPSVVPSTSPSPDLYDYVSLGIGSCLDSSGAQPKKVWNRVGNQQACADSCSAISDCSGYRYLPGGHCDVYTEEFAFANNPPPAQLGLWTCDGPNGWPCEYSMGGPLTQIACEGRRICDQSFSDNGECFKRRTKFKDCYEATNPGHYCIGVAQIGADIEGTTNGDCRAACNANSLCNGYGYWPTVKGGLCRIHSDTSCQAATSSYGDAQGYSRISCGSFWVPTLQTYCSANWDNDYGNGGSRSEFGMSVEACQSECDEMSSCYGIAVTNTGSEQCVTCTGENQSLSHNGAWTFYLKPVQESMDGRFGIRQDGFCVMSNGADQNSGVTRAPGNFNSAEDCLMWCESMAEQVELSGCEYIGGESNACYMHQDPVSHGNGVEGHYCWIFGDHSGSQN